MKKQQCVPLLVLVMSLLCVGAVKGQEEEKVFDSACSNGQACDGV